MISNFKNISIKAKLFVQVGLSILVLTIIISTELYYYIKINNALNMSITINNFLIKFEKTKINEKAYLKLKSAINKKKYKKSINLVKQNFDAINLNKTSSLNKNEIEKIENYLKKYTYFFDNIVKIQPKKNELKQNNLLAYEKLQILEKNTEESLNKIGNKIFFHAQNLLYATNQNLIVLKNSVFFAVLLISIISISIFFLFSLFIINLITKPINNIKNKMKNFNNDLTINIKLNSKDEVGELTHWFNDHIRSLHDVIASVSETIQEFDNSTSQIADSVEEQADFSNEMSSSLAEISSTLQEFSVTAKEIAISTGNVVDIAKKSLTDTQKGAKTVEVFTQKMNEISTDSKQTIEEIASLGKKSKEITKIMELINSIANKTKLIAFNASLEASSAGESGRRFAVVASEIRRLANSVVESTKEIASKINEILSTVNNLVITSEKSYSGIQEGLNYSCETASMINTIVKGSEATTDASKQIYLSTQQQQTGSSQMLLSLKNIEDGSLQSSNALNKLNIASKKLKSLSDNIKVMMDKFKL